MECLILSIYKTALGVTSAPEPAVVGKAIKTVFLIL